MRECGGTDLDLMGRKVSLCMHACEVCRLACVLIGGEGWGSWEVEVEVPTGLIDAFWEVFFVGNSW